jgi:hypothetical protein
VKRVNWQIAFGLSLIVLSVFLYTLHYYIFGDGKRIFLDLLEYVAFVPIQVLLVTLIIDRLLRVREKRTLLNKLNMVIGVFMSEVGMDLIRHLSRFDMNHHALGEHLILAPDWSNRQFTAAGKIVKNFDYQIDSKESALAELAAFLHEKRGFLLSLLENPNLLEHETFTDLLWAVTHVAEELSFRADVACLPEGDHVHLSGDIKRAYSLLISEWLVYMKHLRTSYPYLYSLAVRTNPFNPDARAECY